MPRQSAITNVRIFDGDRFLNDTTVAIDGPLIRAVGGAVPVDAVAIDGRGVPCCPPDFGAMRVAKGDAHDLTPLHSSMRRRNSSRSVSVRAHSSPRVSHSEAFVLSPCRSARSPRAAQ
jgi:hypothetical protein